MLLVNLLSGGGLLPPTPPNGPYQHVAGSSDAGSSSNSTTFAYLPSGSPQLPFAFTPSPHSLPTLAGQVCTALFYRQIAFTAMSTGLAPFLLHHALLSCHSACNFYLVFAASTCWLCQAPVPHMAGGLVKFVVAVKLSSLV